MLPVSLPAQDLHLPLGGAAAVTASISFCIFPSQGATAVAGAGITQSICLPLLSVYQLSTNGTVQVSASGLPLPPPAPLGAFTCPRSCSL